MIMGKINVFLVSAMNVFLQTSEICAHWSCILKSSLYSINMQLEVRQFYEKYF